MLSEQKRSNLKEAKFQSEIDRGLQLILKVKHRRAYVSNHKFLKADSLVTFCGVSLARSALLWQCSASTK